MRVICATVISRGSQNEQTLDQGRRFLTDNRPSILSTFKKSRGLGTGNDDSTGKIKELADSYVLLISVTDFVDVSISILVTCSHLTMDRMRRRLRYGQQQKRSLEMRFPGYCIIDIIDRENNLCPHVDKELSELRKSRTCCA